MSSDQQPAARASTLPPSIAPAFAKAMPRARAAIFWERAYPRLVPPGVVTALFASASFAGVWGMASPEQRMAGVAGFAAALVLSLVRPPQQFRTGSWNVTPRDAARRIDAHSNRPIKLAEMLIDKPAQNTPEEIEKFHQHLESVWQKYQGPFVVGTPKPAMAARDPLRLHIVTAALTVATALWAQASHLDLLQQAFDWKTPLPPKAVAAPIPSAPPLRIKAWVQPPEGIDIRPLELNETSRDKDVNGMALQAHESSTLTIMVYNKKTNITLNGQDIAPKQEISADDNNISYQFEVPLAAGKNNITIAGGPAWDIETRKDLPPTTTLHGIQNKEQRGRKTLDIDYEAKDDYGCQGEIIIEPSHKPEDGKAALPSAQIPRIPVPCR